MLELLFSNPMAFIVIFGGIVLAISIHEAAHAYAADYLGDPTPRSLGRTTLNPLAHLDPLGTLVILVTGFFGWGKPAPFDPYNLKDPKRDTALIALAGPLSNIIIAILISLIMRAPGIPFQITNVLYFIVRLNIGLALFNMIPVAPLDGSKVVGVFLSNEQAIKYQTYQNPLLLLLLILPIFGGASIAALIVGPIANFLLSILI
jgi:Zn-dependent protease